MSIGGRDREREREREGGEQRKRARAAAAQLMVPCRRRPAPPRTSAQTLGFPHAAGRLAYPRCAPPLRGRSRQASRASAAAHARKARSSPHVCACAAELRVQALDEGVESSDVVDVLRRRGPLTQQRCSVQVNSPRPRNLNCTHGMSRLHLFILPFDDRHLRPVVHVVVLRQECLRDRAAAELGAAWGGVGRLPRRLF